MVGMKLGVAILGVAALAGVSQVEKSVDSLICNNPRALYAMAQYKIAIGDANAALKLVRQAKTSRATANCPETKVDTAAAKSCPYAHRG